MSSSRPAGFLLTGGESRRLGRDKATLRLGPGGATLAVHLGGLLSAVASPALEIGPGVSGLDRPDAEDPAVGPLGAIAVGAAELRRRNFVGPVLVLATDLPLLSGGLLGAIASFPAPLEASVVPVLDGRPQSLCARWSPAALHAAETAHAGGGRRVYAALATAGALRLLGREELPGFDLERELADVDDAASLSRLGLRLPDCAG